jgi:S-adenosylhomocysteine hydrolase
MSNLIVDRNDKSNTLTGLPILDAIIKNTRDKITSIESIENTALIYIHHPLKTSINLLKAIIILGINPKNIFILGKHYSESLEVVNEIISLGINYQKSSNQLYIGEFSTTFSHDIEELWNLFFKKIGVNVKSIIIADHGGYVLSSMPDKIKNSYKITGLEKTTSGIRKISNPEIPIVNVAESFLKKKLESPLIATAIFDKLNKRIGHIKPNKVYGIIGYGSIGKCLSEKLESLGRKVFIFDKEMSNKKNGHVNQMKFRRIFCSDILSVLKKSDYVFGCTGTDTTIETDLFDLLEKEICLISCSSGDIEFLSLLKKIRIKYDRESKKDTTPLDDLFYETKNGGKIRILRGGFPINFDASGESVPSHDIQLTRGLVLLGIIQCLSILYEEKYCENKIYDLNLKYQDLIGKLWAQLRIA